MANDNPALLAAILATPADDLPRLVYADWLDENGEGERAEFIRLAVEIERLGGYYGACKVAHPNAIVGCGSCEACKITRRMDVLIEDGDPHDITAGWQIAPQWAWSYREYEQVAPCPEAIVRRGFVHTVVCTLADWVGGECERCGGSGMSEREYHGVTDSDGGCPTCSGTGRTSGIGPAVVRSHPVEAVRVTDREPFESEGTWSWYPVGYEPGFHEESDLPVDVLFLMEGSDITLSERGRHIHYSNTRDAAMLALSAACIAWAKAENDRVKDEDADWTETDHANALAALSR